MPHEEAERYLSGFLDGELEDSSKELIRAHIASCKQCSKLVEQYRELDRELSSAPRAEARTGWFARVFGKSKPERMLGVFDVATPEQEATIPGEETAQAEQQVARGQTPDEAEAEAGEKVLWGVATPDGVDEGWWKKLETAYRDIGFFEEDVRLTREMYDVARQELSAGDVSIISKWREALDFALIPIRIDFEDCIRDIRDLMGVSANADVWLRKYEKDILRVYGSVKFALDVENVKSSTLKPIHLELIYLLGSLGDVRILMYNGLRQKQNIEDIHHTIVAAINVMERRLLFATNQWDMMRGLRARVESVENPRDAARMQQVDEVFRPYTEGKPVPAGTTPQIMRFLVVSAGVPGLWRRMDEDNPRLADALIGYYGNGLSTVKLVENMPGVTNPGSVGQFLERGLRWLWKEMPEQSESFPLDKHVEFPLEQLQATRKERRLAVSAARAEAGEWAARGREFAMRRWYGSESSSGEDTTDASSTSKK